MKFEWDQKKAESNLQKHGISFADATAVFEDPDRIEIMDDRKDYGETRKNTIGRINAMLVIVVTHTDRKNIIRLISARPANKKERKHYYE